MRAFFTVSLIATVVHTKDDATSSEVSTEVMGGSFMIKSAVLYARFSSMEQAKGSSLERQLNGGRQFVASKGWLLENEIVDKGKSAFHGYNRAEGSGLHKFEAEAREGLHSGKVLVVENIDRLSRQGAKAAAQFIWALNEVGVSVATTHDDYLYAADGQNSDMMELFSIIIKAQLSYEESFKKSERAKSTWQGRHAKIKHGDKATTAIRAPAWINKKGRFYVLDEYRSKVLNEIYDLYIDGVGIFKIAQILNDRCEPVWAVRKQDGKGGWHIPYVHRLLTKRAVLGEYVTVQGETLATDYFPQAISAEKFNRVQATLASKPSTGGHAYKRLSNLLTGIVKCAECGGNAAYENKGTNRIQHVKKNGERVTYNRKHYERLRCNNARRKHTCSNNTLHDYKTVETCILDNLALLLYEESNQEIQTKSLTEAIAELSRQIDGKAQKIERLIDALAEGSKAVSARIVKLEAEIEGLRESLQDIQHQFDTTISQPSKAHQLEVVEALRREINDLDESKRFFARSKVNVALKRVIDTILITREGLFLISGWDEDIWLIFDKEGNRVDQYESKNEKLGKAKID